jgi:hypothetical protein
MSNTPDALQEEFRLVSVSATVVKRFSADTFRAFLMVAGELQPICENISVSSHGYDMGEDTTEPALEENPADTPEIMELVYKAFEGSGIYNDTATDIITRMQNLGIEFRKK